MTVFIIFSLTADHAKVIRTQYLENISENNLNFRQLQCEPGYDHDNLLDPSKSCADTFTIDYDNKTSKESLRILRTGKQFQDYCIVINEDLTYSARVCKLKSVISGPSGMSYQER